MKLYHLDRNGYIKEGYVIEKMTDIVVQKDFLKKHNDEVYNKWFPQGVSSHGRHYFYAGFNRLSRIRQSFSG